MNELLKIKVKYNNKEVEILMPLTARTLAVEYEEGNSIYGAVQAVKALIDKLKEENQQ